MRVFRVISAVARAAVGAPASSLCHSSPRAQKNGKVGGLYRWRDRWSRLRMDGDFSGCGRKTDVIPADVPSLTPEQSTVPSRLGYRIVRRGPKMRMGMAGADGDAITDETVARAERDSVFYRSVGRRWEEECRCSRGVMVADCSSYYGTDGMGSNMMWSWGWCLLWIERSLKRCCAGSQEVFPVACARHRFGRMIRFVDTRHDGVRDVPLELKNTIGILWII